MSKKKSGRLGARLRRHARVTTVAAGVAAKVAGEKILKRRIDRPTHARQLMQALGGLKGPVLKAAQLLAAVPGALPQDYAETLQTLQSQAPPMGWPFVRRRMAAELGPDWEKKFKTFERTATAAASLGQVHRAVTQGGQDVACKLQYPDMDSALAADLAQLNILLGLFERYDGAVQTDAARQEIADRLHEELDYAREARHLALYAALLQDEAEVRVPAPVPALCTPRLLTATWLEGKSILEFTAAPAAARARLAARLFRAWYAPFYFYGALHGDPHPGNYTVGPDLSLNLLDFGCVRLFPPRFVGGVVTLYRALQDDNIAQAVAAYESWGFTELTREMIGILNVWARFLYGPVLDDRVRVIGTRTRGVYGHEVAREVHQALRRAGGVRLPREFVFMDRAALALGSLFLRLNAEVNWHKMFNELIDGFDIADLTARQEKTLKKFNLAVTD